MQLQTHTPPPLFFPKKTKKPRKSQECHDKYTGVRKSHLFLIMCLRKKAENLEMLSFLFVFYIFFLNDWLKKKGRKLSTKNWCYFFVRYYWQESYLIDPAHCTSNHKYFAFCLKISSQLIVTDNTLCVGLLISTGCLPSAMTCPPPLPQFHWTFLPTAQGCRFKLIDYISLTMTLLPAFRRSAWSTTPPIPTDWLHLSLTLTFCGHSEY